MKKLDAFDWLIIAGCAWGCLSVGRTSWNEDKMHGWKYAKLAESEEQNESKTNNQR